MEQITINVPRYNILYESNYELCIILDALFESATLNYTGDELRFNPDYSTFPYLIKTLYPNKYEAKLHDLIENEKMKTEE